MTAGTAVQVRAGTHAGRRGTVTGVVALPGCRPCGVWLDLPPTGPAPGVRVCLHPTALEVAP